MLKYLLPLAISGAALAWSFPAFTQDNRNGVVLVQADPQHGDAMQGGMGGMSDRREMMGRRMMERMGRGIGPSPAGPEHAMMMRIIFALMDGDGDGSLSLQEFQGAHERLFKAMDSNKDGRLSLEEMQSFMHGATGRGRPSAQ